MSLEDVDLEAGILSDLQKLAAKFHLKELIIFGSRADGTASDISDVDLAVKAMVRRWCGQTLRKRLKICRYYLCLILLIMTVY